MTAIIGLGNPLRGDDGVGVRVAELLAACQLPKDVEVIDGGTQGLGVVNLMEGRQRVIFVDAANIGKTPGEFIRFTLDEVDLSGGSSPLGEGQHLNVHYAGLREALLLAQALDTLPRTVVVFGVQPANTDWESRLSPEVEAGLADLIDAILDEVGAS
jgi:hydrogenase maturation protease